MRSSVMKTGWLGLSLSAGAAIVVVLTGMAIRAASQAPAQEQSTANDKCYVCHPGLKTEDITVHHLAMEMSCDDCHGPSVEHMHDEMLMTKPDLLFGRAEVEPMCSNPTCHAPGDGREVYGRQDHKDPEKIEAFFKQWHGRIRPNGRAVGPNSVCTDCHGTHNIDKTDVAESEQEAQWQTLFNGTDLGGWQRDGGDWAVKRGRIVAQPAPAGKPARLWTDKVFEDYLLAVTFRAEWPVRTAIRLRGQNGPAVVLGDRFEPQAFVGSVCSATGHPVLLNTRPDLLDKEGWNTLSVKVQGDRIQVWLNAQEIGAVLISGPHKGRIGLQIDKHPDNQDASLEIREVILQPLPKTENSADPQQGT